MKTETKRDRLLRQLQEAVDERNRHWPHQGLRIGAMAGVASACRKIERIQARLTEMGEEDLANSVVLTPPTGEDERRAREIQERGA